ncbi:YdeI/OmpD-associated family protein [Microbacterium sp. KSW2-29]|uniref:YdeI/OmpD-associated family protein n=1 Tax=Microbacterium phycohabitans TaxID=3075993 RepID=A0ABU3SKL0_9MICO|nr:YdeI/OmpD-associated family protein [Microbacterium sp. KSW2-29]MDU0345216.1 YdeI/OmpD-associated family protein [Microbacterium sp. KSW2-29]
MGALDDGERVAAADLAAWSTWLDENHRTSTGAWLLRGRGADAGHYIAYEDAVCEALCFGWIDGPVRIFDEVSSGLWFAPRRGTSGWAATNKARVARLEAEGRLRPAGRLAIDVARANGSWEMLDGPEAGVEPPDLTSALDAVPSARANWDAFPPSSRKFGLTQIATAVRPETRAKRIAKIVSDAAENRRP